MASEAPPIETPRPPQSEETYDFRRLIGAAILTLACSGLAGGIAGGVEAGVTPTGIELGPHQATAQFTPSDSRFRIDLGPLGSADRPSNWEMGGVKIVVKEIPVPANQTALGNAGATASQYEQLLADPNHIEKAAIHTVATRIEHNSIEGAALFGAAGLGLYGLTVRQRHRKQQTHASALQTISELENLTEEQRNTLLGGINTTPRSWSRLCGGVMVASMLLLTACGDSSTQHTKAPDQTADHILDGTPLQGFRLHGALLELLVDEGGGRLKDFIRTNNTYYDQVAANFNHTFTEKFQETPLAHDNLVYVLSISDNHCNIGMDRVHGAIAKAFRVAGVIDSGDMTMSGTRAEEECVSSEADALTAPGRKLLLAAGNHDSPTIEDLATKHGFSVLSLGTTTDLAGLKVMGTSDPNQSQVGVKIHPRGIETVTDVAGALARAARIQHPDILVAHEPEMIQPALDEGDAPFGIAGHTHTFVPPQETNQYTGSFMMIEGTSGGAKKDTLTIGPLQQTAVETVVVFDKTTKQAVGYYLIQTQPDQTVTISDFRPIDPTPVSPRTPGAD
ncbi:MAG TPA: hypothetical protein VLG92_02405 [Candidatus Saccharimonadia bacterium]|nr:hypothetical protein [Candidatus Saccharimonadia bacterium]